MTAGKVQVKLCQTSQIPLGEGRCVDVGPLKLAVFHTKEGFFAIHNSCPHKEGPLADGIVAGGNVYCPLHNWAIELRTGHVVDGGEGMVEKFTVLEEGGDLYTVLDEERL